MLPEFRVVTVDLPEHGESGWPEGFTPKTFLEDTVEELGRFVDSYEKPLVVGNSLGGYLALELGLRGHTSGSIGLSPAGFMHGKLDLVRVLLQFGVMGIAGRLMHPLIPKIISTKLGRSMLFWSVSAKPGQISEDVARRDIRGMRENNVLARRPKIDFTFSSQVDDSIPLHCIWGNADLILIKGWRKHKKVMPQAQLTLLPEVGHITMYDDPQRVVDEIRVMQKAIEAKD